MAHVIAVGAGNVGSQVARHLARSPSVSRVTIIDSGRYTPDNLQTQDIDACEVGAAKADVQAARLRRIHPTLPVTSIVGRVEDQPLGALRADAILACVDSRRARLTINQAAWRLGTPWIDSGVSGQSLLARVQVYVPAGSAAACLECAWEAADYAAVEQVYPCEGDAGPAPTNASSSLGALAAALQTIECEKLLTGQRDRALIGRDVLVDALHHKHYVTAFRRNPACRMPDHGGWRIDALPTSASRMTVRDAFALGQRQARVGENATFAVAGQRLALKLTCPGCGESSATFRLERAVRAAAPACRQCGRSLQVSGFDLHDATPLEVVPWTMLDGPLADVGIETGDVLSLATSSGETYFEIGGDA
jgi:molybdopterin/thiamine biosynthesis adenylyltransferase